MAAGRPVQFRGSLEIADSLIDCFNCGGLEIVDSENRYPLQGDVAKSDEDQQFPAPGVRQTPRDSNSGQQGIQRFFSVLPARGYDACRAVV